MLVFAAGRKGDGGLGRPGAGTDDIHTMDEWPGWIVTNLFDDGLRKRLAHDEMWSGGGLGVVGGCGRSLFGIIGDEARDKVFL